MFKHILVALDGSTTASLALDEAITIAKESGSTVRGIYVIDAYHVIPEVEFITVKEVIDSMRHEGNVILAEAQKKLDRAGLNANTSILETGPSCGRISEVIAKEAKSWPADLIVVGTHGRKGFSHLFLGSVAESIVRVATKPVLLIRGQEKKH
jgi:nucleotide-binding universal stress UspA family protein